MNLFLIILLGLFLRIAYLIKPEGLWNDEYVAWAIASTPFKEGFWHEVFHQCHMPLYYLYLKIFGDSDLLLRLSSVIPNILAIYVMYKVGKLQSKSTAIVLSLITACTSFLIYYSQEVRFYSLLFLFSALMLLFILKYLNNNSLKNLFGYTLASLLVLLTHTIGFVFVFITTLYLIIKSKNKKLLTLVGAITLLITIPGAIYIFNHVGTSQWWGTFTYRNIIFMFTDFFSPILTNNINVPSAIFRKDDLLFNMILITPTIIAVSCIIKTILKNKIAKELALIAAITTVVLTTAAITGKFVFITKYNIEILPILLYLFAKGINNNKPPIKILILTIWLTFHLGYFFSPNYETKLPRKEGNRIPVSLLLNEGISPNDTIISTYYNADRFRKYLDISKYSIINIDKGKTTEIITNKGQLTPYKYVHNREHIEKYIENIIEPNKRYFVIFLNSVSFFPDSILEGYINNEKKKIKIHPMYIESSILKNEFIKYSKLNNLEVKSNSMGSWTLLIINKEKN